LDKTVFITGANGGIGRSLCKIFKKNNWSVIGCDIIGTPNKNCNYFYSRDISRAENSVEIRDDLKANKIHLDCLINNAAVQIEKNLVDTLEDEWNSVVSINLGAVFLTTKYFTELLNGGSIINISSVHARATSKGIAAYAASKGGVSALTRAVALELADYGIRVNAILPGAIDTRMLREGLQRNYDPEVALNKIVEATPLKKIGDPEDVANLALFLADDRKANNITGQEFICDGGVLARLGSE